MLSARVDDKNEMAELVQKKSKEEKELKDEIRDLERKVDELTKVKKDSKEKQNKLKTKL